MYKIILHTWYQETPDIIHEEPYDNMEFEHIIDAAEYLGKNIEYITEWFPVTKITIE